MLMISGGIPAKLTNGTGSVAVNTDGSVNANGGGSGTVPAFTITPPATSLSALDIHSHNTGQNAALRIWNDDGPTGWNPRMVIGVQGDISTNAWVSINGHPSQAYGPGNVTTDDYMLGVNADVTAGIIIGAGSGVGNYALGILAADQSVTAAGRYTFIITPDGAIRWGPGTVAGKVPTMDTNLYRSGIGQLKSDGQIQAAQGLTTIAVAGAVSDASFTAPPPIGTLAVDTTGNLYAKTAAATWKKVAIA